MKNSFQRKEIKFLLNTYQYNELLTAIEQHMNPDKYCEDKDEYHVFNIYYDTHDDYLIRTSLQKPYYKEKLRLRSYCANTQPDDKVFLEIKKKIGGIVNKRRVVMTLEQAEHYLETRERPECKKYIQTKVFDEIDAFLDRYDVSEKQYISYIRSAWFGKDDSDFRITFDRAITTRRYDLGLNIDSYGEQLINFGEYLLEVKIRNTMPMWLAKKLAELKIYKISFSKYGRAYKNHVLSEPTRKYA
ncbi:molecular chaperone [Clostridia bacterium]|nr:molecular chaperone [Clostridia bacterium]